MRARFIAQFTPILIPILAHVTDRDNRDQSIFSGRGHGWVESRWGVNVKTGIGRQAQVTDDALKIFAIVMCKEKRMRSKSFVSLINSPKETDDRAREAFARQRF